MSEEPDICDICTKPIQPGEAVYAGLRMKGIMRHWRCHEAKHGTLGDARKEMRNAFDKLTGSLGELRAMARKLRR